MILAEPIALTPLAGTALDALAAILRSEGLPADDVHERSKRFFRLHEPLGTDLGYAGIELCGMDALLRSVVALPCGQGQGKRIVVRMADYAEGLGVTRLYLLTTTAEGFFAKLGFRRVARETAPAAIRETREFASLCPATAALMLKEIQPSRRT